MSGEHDQRPWGFFTVLDESAIHKVKRVDVQPGVSYQRRRAEHWFVLARVADVTLDGVVQAVGPGEAIEIPQGAANRIANTGTEALMFVEVQDGDYVGQDDIERREDDFGRAG